MIDTQMLEEEVLIEAAYAPWPLWQVVQEVQYRNKELAVNDVYTWTSNIISSLIADGLVELRFLILKKEGDVNLPENEADFEGFYSVESEKKLDPDETASLLRETEKWEEMNILSETTPCVIAATRKGVDHYNREIMPKSPLYS